MKNKFILPLGMLCLAMYFILNRFTEAPDFVQGFFVGLSIALNLIGIFVPVKWIRRRSGRAKYD